METEEDSGEVAPLKERPERKKKPFIKLSHLNDYKGNVKTADQEWNLLYSGRVFSSNHM